MNKYILILIQAITFFACNQNKVSYNTPDQKEYINRWKTLLRDYNETENSVKKSELIEKCTQLFNEHKSFTNWKGQVKEVNSFDDYAQLIIAQMRNEDERTTAEFHVNIYKNSASYNLIKTLKESDEIVFSGAIDSEISITGYGKITEPELLVSCTNINGIENTLPENTETKGNGSDGNSSTDKIRNIVNERISNNLFFNNSNGLYTALKFEPLNDGAPLGVMVLSQLQCHFTFGYTITGNKIECEYMESTCGRTSSNRTFFYDESNDCIYMNYEGQKFIFTNSP